mmetsp:Transcript_102279/g.228487  ORF Transcript_102279/g.228487 Transcript_102279/m.228487 type:complete len:616 (-) Transcript_102279:75-1922(-)
MVAEEWQALGAELRATVEDAMKRGLAEIRECLKEEMTHSPWKACPPPDVSSGEDRQVGMEPLSPLSPKRRADAAAHAWESVEPEDGHEWTKRHMRGFVTAAEKDMVPPPSHREAQSDQKGHGAQTKKKQVLPVDQVERLKTSQDPSEIKQSRLEDTLESTHDNSTNGEDPMTPPGRSKSSLGPASRHPSNIRPSSTMKLSSNKSSAWKLFTKSAHITSAQLYEGRGSIGARVVALVQSPQFDSVICCLIVLNAMSIGIQTDMSAQSLDPKAPILSRIFETIFCVVFTAELIVRIYVYKLSFFVMPGWGWNWFDMFVVGLQLTEEIGTAIVPGSADVVPGSKFSFVRVLRILRLIRVVRLIRILRLIGDLRMLVISIINSMRSLFWTVVLLFLMIYTISLYLTQLVADHRIENVASNTIDEKGLTEFYGSLGDTMLTMFQSITGGLDWAEALTPLKDNISPWAAMVFAVYIGFTLLAMLNVITGIFVESVLKSAKADKDNFMVNNARELFQTLEDGIQTQMSWDVFESKLSTPQMEEFFKAIDVDPSEAKGLFHLLDLDGSGSVSADEFLNGCLRLSGTAKALDLALVIQEVRQVGQKMSQQGRMIEEVHRNAHIR